MSADREILFRRFGPQVIEAMVNLMYATDKLHVQKINAIIDSACPGMPKLTVYTKGEYWDFLEEQLNSTPIYSWMTDGE